ncbi:D-aminoacyl-tRNA deacylase [uncultured Methanofollis sp.]|uniref:D-aminoacyl-tRNA deacylase n=1 Tax=uncultured Methanofollis sp. TaxID=262500 RepID=UPI0026362E1F|nr:D-aminoacyl-tRNA deacylase [uncultured Methanofollis sp.]
MHIAFLHSSLDPAGRNLARRTRELLSERDDWPLCRAASLSFHETGGRLIYAEGADRDLGADVLVFLSRHSSTHPTPALTVHVTGNYGDPVFGGEARTLAPAAPAMMHAVLRGLARHAPPGYRASYEATHHGPTTLSTPSLFVEIGSTETEWNDPAAADAAARAVLEAVPGDVIPLLGFGGTHYAVRQTEIALSSQGAFGHIAPSREVPALDRDLVAAMARQTGSVAAYLDRKALAKTDTDRLQEILAGLGLPVLSEGEITDIGDLSWETYTAIRAAAEEIAPDGRVHPGALAGSGRPVVVTIPGALVSEADKAGPKAFREALALLPAASIAGEHGEILPTFITFENQRKEIIHYLISLCIKIIDDRWSTATDGDDLVVMKTRFDPGRARKLGVPKGPLFGRLSSGQTIEVGGGTITPAMVSSCSETRIHIPGLERYIDEVHS